MAVCMPHLLGSLPAAASCPPSPSSSCFVLSISCSSKRKKKSQTKPKDLPPTHLSKLSISQEDGLFLDMGSGASTLKALQPLADEEETPLQQKQKLELQLSQYKVAQNPPSSLPADQSSDPLLRFTLAACEPLDVAAVFPDEQDNPDAAPNALKVSPDGRIDRDDEAEGKYNAPLGLYDADQDDEAECTYNAPLGLYGAAHDFGGDEEEGDGVADKDGSDSEMEYEWVEVNGDESDDDEDEIFLVYWEGGLHSMAKQEKEGDSSSDATDIDEDDETYLEAEAALAQFEADAKRRSASKHHQRSHAVKLSDEHAYPKDNEADASDEDRYDIISSKASSRKIRKMDEDFDDEVDEENKQQKRSIPAVMRSFDRAKIYAKAGDGGNGVVAFRREKFVPYGGPSGGSGGRGGHVFVRSDPSLNSLLCFRKCVHYRAGRGSHGMGKSQDGAMGTDCFIDVPLGTVIREASGNISGSGKILLEVTRPGQSELLLPGGRGGRGNAAFKTGRNKTPQIAENGEQGAEMWLDLELKLVADVGIIGVPNAGKSTLLSVISAAQPAIGAYPFTTLLPNLGVVPIGFESTMVVADLPGLIEGAHLGVGLGHEFLRHTERCRVLVHMIDGMSQQPEEEYEAVRLELELFNPILSEKPCIIAFNKMDIPEVADRWPDFQKYLNKKGIEPICISAVTKAGVTDVVNKAYKILQSLPSFTYDNGSEENGSGEMGIAEKIKKHRSSPIEEFEIIEDKATRTWQVQGIGLERFTQMTNWEYFEALSRFQHVLIVSGVNKALKERGVIEGDVVTVGQMEFVWNDSEDMRALDWKRGFRGSRLWPH